MRLKAVTLIELIVAIAIMAILLVAAVPMIAQSNKNDGVKREAQRLVTFIQRAKTFAQNPESSDAISYQVVKNGADSFTIKRCVATGNCNFTVEELRLNNVITQGWSDLKYAVYDGKYSGNSTTTINLARDNARIVISMDSGQPNIISSD